MAELETESGRGLKILHLITMLEMGGAQFNTILSAEDAVRRGHKVWLAGAPGPLSGEARRRLGDQYFEVHQLVREVNPVRDVAAFLAILSLVRRLAPDVVHTHSSKAGILGRWASRFCRVPRIIHTAHGWGFHDRQAPRAKRFYEGLERATARVTDRIVVVADANREKALAAGIGRPEQYVTIRSGIDAATPRWSDARVAVRRELGLDPDEFVVATAGNYKPQKDPLAAARIMARFLKARPAARFVAIGDGPLRREAESVLAGEGINVAPDGRAIFLGWREDGVRTLAAADVLLHTAVFEGLPRIVVEAAALGIPAITTDVDGIPEIVRDGVNGYLFAPGDESDMESALVRLCDDPALRARLSAAARESFTAEFHLETMFDALDREYRA